MAEFPEQLLELAAAYAVPEHLRASRRRARFGNAEPEAGQVWRASWDELSCLVLVLGKSFDTVSTFEVVPVIIGAGAVGAHVLSAADSGWDVDLCVQTVMATWLPLRVFDEAIDEMSEGFVTACRHDATPLDALIADEVFAAPLSEDLLPIAEVADSLASFARVPELPVADQATGDLRTLGFSITDVQSALDVSQAEAMRMLTGRQRINASQAGNLAALKNIAPSQVIASCGALPAGLVSELDKPRWKSRLRSLARHFSLPEIDIRLHSAYGTLQTAYRQTGAEPDWSDRLQRYLESEEAKVR